MFFGSRENGEITYPINGTTFLVSVCPTSGNNVYNQICYSFCINSSTHGQNGRRFADDIFICILWMKSFVFCLKFHWSLLLRVQLQQPSIGLDYELAPNRRQAITWTDGDPVQWRINAALGLDELTWITSAYVNEIYLYSTTKCQKHFHKDSSVMKYIEWYALQCCQSWLNWNSKVFPKYTLRRQWILQAIGCQSRRIH